MTATEERERPPSSPGDPPPDAAASGSATAAIDAVCPYLRAESGSWRGAYPAREHLCWAVAPAARLVVAKQRSLCLVPAHETCATYRAAQDATRADAVADGLPADGAPGMWPATRSAPLVLESSRGLLAPLAGAPGRTGGQALLVGLMAVVFLLLVIAGTNIPPGSTPAPSAPASAGGGLASPTVASPTVASPSAPPSATTAPTPSPTLPTTATPGPTRSSAPTTTPAAGGTSYTVKSGDTLSGIAARFGVTVKALKDANGITDPRLIRPGQVLTIP